MSRANYTPHGDEWMLQDEAMDAQMRANNHLWTTKRPRVTRATKVASTINLNTDIVEVGPERNLRTHPRQGFTSGDAHRYANKLIIRWLERSRKEQREWKRKRAQMFRMIRYQTQEAQAFAQAS